MKNELVSNSTYAPGWATRQGRWLAQKSLVVYDTPFLDRPPRAIVWMSARRLNVRMPASEEARQLALSELGRIPMLCPSCEWRGYAEEAVVVGDFPDQEKKVTYRMQLSDDPNSWLSSGCPACEEFSDLILDCGGVNPARILRRWHELSGAEIESPFAGRFEPPTIRDLSRFVTERGVDTQWPRIGRRHPWLRDINYGEDGDPLRPNELVFIAQQLWGSLAETMSAVVKA